MIPGSQEEDWDLTPVIDLIYSLSTHKEQCTEIPAYECASRVPPATFPVISSPKNGIERTTQLGDFDKIWQYLGQPTNLLPPDFSLTPKSEDINTLDINGQKEPSPFKAVKWRDELEGADLADNDENHDPLKSNCLTKAQRKKARRKERRKVEARTEGRNLPSESENDLGKDEKESESQPEPQPSDRKAIINEILHGRSPSTELSSRLRSGKLFRSESTDPGEWPIASPHSAKQVVQVSKPLRDTALAIVAAKTAKLMTMLHQKFIDERQYLKNISFVQPSTISSGLPLEGLHVFVDASNVCLTNSYHQKWIRPRCS